MAWFTAPDTLPKELQDRLNYMARQGVSESSSIVECIGDAFDDYSEDDDGVELVIAMCDQFCDTADSLRTFCRKLKDSADNF